MSDILFFCLCVKPLLKNLKFRLFSFEGLGTGWYDLVDLHLFLATFLVICLIVDICFQHCGLGL